jgi:hypothetical protein
MPNKDDRENDVILEMHHVGNYEEFSCINNSFQCYNENEDCEEAIVEQTAVKHKKISEDQDPNDDTTKHEQLTNQAARKYIAALLIMQEYNEGIPISPLETSTDDVQLQSLQENTAMYTRSIPPMSLTQR